MKCTLHRYREQCDTDYDMLADEYIESTTLTTLRVKHTKKQVLKQLFNFNKYVRSNSLSSYVASFQTTCFSEWKKIFVIKTVFNEFLLSAILCLPLSLYLSHWYELDTIHWITVLILIGIMSLQLISIAVQPASTTPVAFKVQ